MQAIKTGKNCSSQRSNFGGMVLKKLQLRKNMGELMKRHSMLKNEFVAKGCVKKKK